MKNKFYVFDFDGTLAQVEERPESPEKIEEVGWNGKDWWGSEASLKNIQPNEEVFEEFKKAKADPSAHVIILTGRRGVIAHGIRNWLRSQNLYGKRKISPHNKQALRAFDQRIEAKKDILHPNEDLADAHDEYFCGDYSLEPEYPRNGKHPDGSTMAHKYFVVNMIMNDKYNELHFWDDRSDHISHLIKMGLDFLKKYKQLENCMLHRVFPGNPASVQHIPIRQGMSY